jgi:hypothetical protein
MIPRYVWNPFIAINTKLISGEKITAGLCQKRRLEMYHVIHASFMDGEQIIPPLMPNQIQAQRNDAVTHGEADYLVGLSQWIVCNFEGLVILVL